MSSRFSIEKVSLAVLEKHTVALHVVSEVLRMNSQPIHVIEGDETGLVFALRVNLNEMQFQRLIKKEIEGNLPGYEMTADWKGRRFVVVKSTQAKNADPTSDDKSTGVSKQASA